MAPASGAPLHRRIAAEAGRIYLRRVRLNSGGYDTGGAYWGLGAPLWQAMDRDVNCRIFRAADRANAKATVLEDLPDARFYR